MNVFTNPPPSNPLDLTDRGSPWLVGESDRLDVERESPPPVPSIDAMLAVAARRARKTKTTIPTT